MKKKEKKALILGRLAANLRACYPELDQHFMCPTCLATFPVSEVKKISEAHIVPDAAGGSLKTYICTDCNSRFGAKQDKWLGEHLHLKRNKNATFLDTASKPGYFDIGGIRVQGTYQAEPDGSLGFYIYADKTSPDALRRILAKRPNSITIPFPLGGKGEVVNVGFLTAAYLLWFKELGYSWALQAHLDQVRVQIRNPDKKIIQERYLAVCPGNYFETPWIGVAQLREEIAVIAAIGDRMIFLPTADRKEFYSKLGNDFDGVSAQYRRLQFATRHNFGGPVAIMYHDRTIVFPDPLLRREAKGTFILYPPGEEDNPCILYEISNEEAERLKKSTPNYQLIKAKYRLEMPAGNTGRPVLNAMDEEQEGG